MISLCEYIWIDGAIPTRKLRSKARFVFFNKKEEDISLSDFPEWGFDGSSTYQAQGNNSDLILKPVNFVKNPLRGEGNFLLMCEVLNPDRTPHPSNTRAKLRRILSEGAEKEEPWFGVEQEYTLFKDRIPLGWPDKGYPAPQGPFYCGVGADEVFGRELVEDHTESCIYSGLMIFGINAEVMPGQWEFQIGYRGIEGEDPSPLNVGDHTWIARWLLYRLGEDFGITATLDPKPVRGDWNGAGQHTNFSTKSMRDPKTGGATIKKYIELLSKKHKEHIDVYGHRLSERLTGLHETCHINEFRSGVADRGASIRIPRHVSEKGYGYLEDRRPGANADPYEVSTRILKTICEI
ncbi:MAG: glutamine synthetase beta-grasp domain-containing protein [Bdellovibrionaceae bacterium]|nr:glutamine synthetase beta-grasp domain-containing protein [Pseudobdellovibrionaceae bacterium]